MNTKQQPPLPTLQPGDSHMESLIEAAIQGHASTRDAMRWLVRQLVPAIQQEDAKTDEPVVMPIYQCQLANGSWIDQSKHSYEYNVKHGQATVRVVYTHPAQGAPEAVAGELDPLRAYEFGQLITKYSESFNGQKWGGVYDSVDRKNLAVALDHLTEAGAMLMNISERLLRTNPTPAASVTDEQIAACVKRASTYGLPFVGLLNPGGTPSDFSKRFTAEILALRPVQVPMTDEQIRPLCKQGWVFETVKQWVSVIEAHHGITAQAKKETP